MGFLGNGLVIRPPSAAGALAPAPGGAAPSGTGEINLSNILKLIPADIVAVYLAGKAVVAPENLYWGFHWPFWFCLLCMLACLILRYAATKSAPGGVNWLLILVSIVAFFIWAHAVSETQGPVIPGFYGGIAGVVAMLFGIVAPVIVPAQP
jgi:hypothetical protein